MFDHLNFLFLSHMTKKISHNMGHKRLRVLKISHVHIRLNYFTSLAVFTSEPFFNTYASVAAVSKAGLALSVRMLRTTRRTGARILRINIAACFQTSLAKSLHYTSFPRTFVHDCMDWIVYMSTYLLCL